MRESLKALEGQTVVFKGRITERQLQPDGTYTVCLAAVEVRKHTNKLPLQQVTPVKVDHLWIRDLSPEAIDWRGLLRSMNGAGTVIYYRRGDGSVDLSIRSRTGICLDSLWYEVNAEPKRHERAALLGSASTAIKEGVPYWSWGSDPDKTAAAITRARDRYEANAALNLAVHLLAQNKGPCRGLDLLPLRNCRRPPARGVA